jgi:hypothetical protein
VQDSEIRFAVGAGAWVSGLTLSALVQHILAVCRPVSVRAE